MSESRDMTADDARAAAEIEADIGVEHIARVYAKALLDTTERTQTTAAVLDEFDAVLAEVVDPFPKLEAVLASALVSPEEKAVVLDRVLKGRVSATLVNFLKVVAQHGRLDCLRSIHAQARVLLDQLRNRITVRVTTATPLDDAAIQRIVDSLRAKIGGEPVIHQEVDPALIGGVILRIGDTVHDGSIATQLNNLRQQMIESTAHEIQSRRDRFRNPAGN